MHRARFSPPCPAQGGEAFVGCDTNMSCFSVINYTRLRHKLLPLCTNPGDDDGSGGGVGVRGTW